MGIPLNAWSNKGGKGTFVGMVLLGSKDPRAFRFSKYVEDLVQPAYRSHPQIPRPGNLCLLKLCLSRGNMCLGVLGQLSEEREVSMVPGLMS